MQMGFAARGAVTAIELARRGMPGPRAPISGQFGYFQLFDGGGDPAPFDGLGRVWRICELSHKPCPSAPATDGGRAGLRRPIPARPLSPDAARAKFTACCRLLPESGSALWLTIASLEGCIDRQDIAAFLAP